MYLDDNEENFQLIMRKTSGIKSFCLKKSLNNIIKILASLKLNYSIYRAIKIIYLVHYTCSEHYKNIKLVYNAEKCLQNIPVAVLGRDRCYIF